MRSADDDLLEVELSFVVEDYARHDIAIALALVSRAKKATDGVRRRSSSAASSALHCVRRALHLGRALFVFRKDVRAGAAVVVVAQRHVKRKVERGVWLLEFESLCAGWERCLMQPVATRSLRHEVSTRVMAEAQGAAGLPSHTRAEQTIGCAGGGDDHSFSAAVRSVEHNAAACHDDL